MSAQIGRPPRRARLITAGVTLVGVVIFTALLLARIGVVVAIGGMLVVWLVAFVVSRRAGSPVVGPMVAALPYMLVACVLAWLLVIYGGAGG